MNIKKIAVVVCALVMSAFFLFPTGISSVEAAGQSDIQTYMVSDGQDTTVKFVDVTGRVFFDTSGVTELDEAKDRTDSLINWICKWIGATIAIISLIVAAMMASSHQTEQRNQALAVMVLGIVIFFAPQIIDYLLGK